MEFAEEFIKFCIYCVPVVTNSTAADSSELTFEGLEVLLKLCHDIDDHWPQVKNLVESVVALHAAYFANVQVTAFPADLCQWEAMRRAQLCGDHR